MGGQHGYFGLWLDCDFGRGHSRARPRCTTYGSPQLSGEEQFTVDTVEVWGVGQPPEQQEQVRNQSYLYINTRECTQNVTEIFLMFRLKEITHVHLI